MNLWAEWAVTSSVLILTVILLRAVLGKRLRAGVRYVLWGLVLLRLLVPVQLFAVPVLDAEPVETPGQQETGNPGASLGGETPDTTPTGVPGTVSPGNTSTSPENPLPGGRPGNTQMPAPGGDRDDTQTGERDPDPGAAPEPGPDVDPVDTSGREPVNFGTLLLWVWLGGAIATGLILAHFNLRFAVTLRHERRPLKGAACRLPVYVLEGLPSPCLFGVFRPALYLSPEAAEEPRMLRHVLSHEETHYRHGDHIWSLLRCAALAVHWWNPLVWLAVSMSRRDGELFCDEGALKKLGDGERSAYGNTLLTLVTAGPSVSMLMSCATTMSGGKKALRERISRIAIPVKRHAWAVALALTVAVVAAACAFIDPVEKSSDPTDTPDPTENSYPVPTVFPEGEPERVLSLAGLEPYAPPEVTNTGSFQGTVVDSVTVGGHTVVLLENDQGQRAVAVTDGDEQRVFMTGLDQYDEIEAFEDVFGLEGVRVRYRLIPIYDYFRFTETGEPVLMLRTEAWSGEPVIADFDGDGRDEVVDGREIFFLRDGALYRADLETLLNDEAGQYRESVCHAGDRCVEWIYSVESIKNFLSRTYTRLIYFDGENLRVYKENKTWHDHVVDGVGEGIPSEVMAAARNYVEKETIVQNPDGTYSRWSSYSQSVIGDALYDDWRIENFSLDWQQLRDGGWTVEVYFFNYELHTTTPEKVGLAASTYLTEDDWFCPTYPDCEMLVFKNDGGVRTFLWHSINNDMFPGTPEFQEYLDNHLANLGLGSADPYEEIRNSTLDILYSNTKEYKYVYNGAKEGDEAAKEAALKMAERFMEDLTTTDELTFRVTEYRNLDVRLRPTLELVANGGMNGKDEYLYKYTLLDSEVGEDRWIVKLYVEFRYEGWMDRYGIAPTRQMYEEEDGWFNTLAGYVNNQVWFLLTRDGNTYTMRSRLDALKEAGLYEPFGLAPLPYYDPDNPRDVRLYLDIQYRRFAVAYDNMNTYRYVYHGTKEGDEAAEEAALAMAEMFLDDLLNADDVTFRITQYRNPGVRIISTIEQAETLTGPDGTRIDGFEDLLDGEVGPDKWLVYLYADYRYEWWNDESWQGMVGWPTSQEEFEEKDFWLDVFIQGENQIGCFMYRVGDTFVMQSRMGKMIEIGAFAPLKVNQ